MTAEADNLPTNTRQLLKDYGLVGCHSTRSNDLSIHARIDSTSYVHLLWESIGEDNEFSHAAIFEVKFGEKPRRVITDSRGRTADALFMNLESVAFAAEDSDLSMTEYKCVPTARCIQDTKKRQLVTGSNLQRLRCCVCQLHHEQAKKAPHRQFFANALKKVQHYRVDVANATTNKYYKRQEYQDLYNSSVAVMLREMQREVNMDLPFESRLHIDYSTNNHHSQLLSTDYPDCCFMAISHGENRLDPE